MKRELEDSIRSADALLKNARRLASALSVELRDGTRTLNPELLGLYDIIYLGFNYYRKCPMCGDELPIAGNGLDSFVKELEDKLVLLQVELDFWEGDETV